MTRADAAARLGLTLVCEPGDARLPDLLAEHGTEGLLVGLCEGRTRRGAASWPEAWIEAARALERRLPRVTAAATAAGLRWITPGDPQWPQEVDDLDHVEPTHSVTGAPLGLWVRGSDSLGELSRRSVAVVGARDCTPYGAEVAAELAADVADSGVTVVSGGAFGIDASAHRGALALERPTVAVLACGADLDYPKAHSALLRRIGEVGLVVSEQPPGTAPTKGRFLSRNRLIAALSGGTVVVEARRRSGSLNTLHWADQLGRPTMAVPGPVGSQQSGGTHRAVRDGAAVLVTSGEDVLGELAGPGVAAEAGSGPSTEFDRLPVPAQRALDTLDWREPRSPARVGRDARLGSRQVGPALAVLERHGLAERVETGWVLLRRADLA